MRYYLGSCEYKWTHAHKSMEDIWVRREIGEQLFKQCNQPGFDLVYIRSNSQTLPNDIYCRCDIYVDVQNTRQGLLFAMHGYKEVHKEHND
jgi:hypothetical protein